MSNLAQLLSGKKTYIIGVAAIVTIAGYLFGVVDAETANTLLGLLGFGGLITLRAGLAKATR